MDIGTRDLLDLIQPFFDLVIFLLMGLTGIATAWVVWFEKRYAHEKLDVEGRAIVMRSVGFGVLFLWFFFRGVFPVLDTLAVTWSLRAYLLVAMVNYLVVLVRAFKIRHGLGARQLIYAPFRKMSIIARFRR